MLLSFLEQELTQKINLYYYPFHFSLVCLLMFCSQKKLLFLDERISCLKTKKADQRGERLSDGRHQLGEGDESECAADWEAIFVQFHVHKIKAGLTFCVFVHLTNCPGWKCSAHPSKRDLHLHHTHQSVQQKSKQEWVGLARDWLEPLSITDTDFEATAQDKTVFSVNLRSQNTNVLTSVSVGPFAKRPYVLFHVTVLCSSPLSPTTAQRHFLFSNLPGSLTLTDFLGIPSWSVLKSTHIFLPILS